MDFKFRAKNNQNQRKSDDEYTSPGFTTKPLTPVQGLNKYERRIQTSQNSLSQKQVNKVPNNSTIKNSSNIKQNINRYYRSDAAPKTQYKLFLSDSNNIFYEERQSIKLLKFYKKIKIYTLSILFLLFILYFILYFIQPFQGQCPINAQCGVFVHCYNGFQYDQSNNQCILSKALYDQIQDITTQRIIKARYEWGYQQCNNEKQKIPTIALRQLLVGIDNNHLVNKLTHKIQIFLKQQINQQQLYFSYDSDKQIIQPTFKKYSVYCQVEKIVNSSNFKVIAPVCIAVIIVLILIVIQIRKRVIAQKIYQQLRKRTINEKPQMLNISYAKADLQKQFGTIDEKIWKLIDNYRTKDRDIGFLQDDFLYWKML